MAALLALYPDLATEIAQKHAISVTGCCEGSAMIRFEGQPTTVEIAREEMDQLTCRFLKTELEFNHPLALIPSAKKKLKFENILVYLCLPSVTLSKLTVGAFTKTDHDRAVEILMGKIFENCVAVSSQSLLDQLSNHPEHNFPKLEDKFSVAIRTTGDKVFISGYLLPDVQSVRQVLSETIKDLSVTKVPLSCTPEQAQYLKLVLFNEPTEESKSFLSSLPARVSYARDKIMLQGSQEATQEAQKRIINGSFVKGLLCRTFSFDCHNNFLSQIKQFILEPFKERKSGFVYMAPEVKGRGKAMAKKDEASFTISVFSREQADFGEICQQLEGLHPGSKRLPLRPKAMDCAKGISLELERKYHVRIQPYVKGVYIHGLTDDEIEQCWGDLEDFINSNLVIIKHIPIDAYQARYLFRKCGNEFANLKTGCLELYVPREAAHYKQEEALSIRIKATVKQVEMVEERITEMVISGFVTEKFTVSCPQKLYRMWNKRWKEVKREQENAFDLLIDFQGQGQDDRRRLTSNEEDQPDVEVEFVIFGPDKEGIDCAKDVIIMQESGQWVDHKQLQLSAEGIRALLKELQQKKLDLSHFNVDLDINKVTNTVTLTSPQAASDDLAAVEADIQRVVVDRTIATKEIACDDPVVGLILGSKSRSMHYLGAANRLAKPHNVSIRPLRKPRIGLILTGNQAAIQVVEPAIQAQVIEVIKKSIGLCQLRVQCIYAPVFSSSDFAHFDAKLQEDLCVLGSYPKTGKQSKALKSVLLQPSASAHCIRVEICKGSLVYEQTDAIINAANEDLKHIGGLAKAILDVGGITIQQESDEYVRSNGKLKTEGVVCLEAGSLPCKKVIHAVGPRWVDGRHNEEQSVYFTVLNVLGCANRENLGSISLPAISTGIFGVPEEVCARASMKAIRDFCQANSDSIIHTVRFVLYVQSTLDAFLAIFESGVFNGCSVEESSADPNPKKASSSHTWLWEDHASFVPYSPDICSKLTSDYIHKPTGLVALPISGQMYIINFSTMTQTNVATGHERRVQYIANKSTATPLRSIQWHYADDKGQFTPYKPDDSRAIEAMYQACSAQQLLINGKAYTFDFVRMCQINTQTNYRRSIRRGEEVKSSTGAEAAIPSPPPEDIVPQKDLVIVLRGPKDVLPAAEAKLKEKLKSSLRNNDIPLPQALPQFLERKVKGIASKHGVTYTIQEKTQKGDKVLKLRGLAFSVNHATSAIQEEIINYQFSSTREDSVLDYPREWQPEQQKTTELYPVTQDTPEWKKVSTMFHVTMPGATILKITRLQNIWLWEKYVRHRKMLHTKNDGKVNEKELFHGTRGNNPENIYASEEGFDMRFSRDGMWGRANYFAENARYSNAYAFQTSDGKKEMFLVRVLTGDSYNCPSDSTLRLPPVKQVGAAGRQVQFAQTRYDTVSGITGGSKVYMTYDNHKAYPSYLIKYSG